jgi:hypothetical protein
MTGLVWPAEQVIEVSGHWPRDCFQQFASITHWLSRRLMAHCCRGRWAEHVRNGRKQTRPAHQLAYRRILFGRQADALPVVKGNAHVASGKAEVEAMRFQQSLDLT